ncbi:MAG: aminotransferase class I/II-fold pyridoxal phosphate-dependent enzyme [Candidatus Riflebacteria bacterium]|nr:aminotransferase class I/II-fold pyridoxal phosphate-dependent enzyme [Candidatus Riflebacteria bacterium]
MGPGTSGGRQAGGVIFQERAERWVPRPGVLVVVKGRVAGGAPFEGHLVDLSQSGCQFLILSGQLHRKQAVEEVVLAGGAETPARPLGGTVAWVEALGPGRLLVGAIRFAAAQPELLAGLRDQLVHPSYRRDGLDTLPVGYQNVDFDLDTRSPLVEFYRCDSPDLLQKCREFSRVIDVMQQQHLFQVLFRTTTTSRIDRRVVVANPLTRREQEMINFDGGSPLGLHLHPRVIERVRAVLDQAGAGSPVWPQGSGSTSHLRDLEEILCRFHGREDAMVFPSGYTACLGVIRGLVRSDDLVVRDSYSLAAIQDGCRVADARSARIYPHLDMAALEGILREAANDRELQGRLVASDGVFPLTGRVAPLADLVRIAKAHGASLLVAEGAGAGVLGPTGRGLEEQSGLPGAVDVLVGSFGQAAGMMGGYVTGSRALISYLRFFANPGIFTTAMPAHVCAGVTEAYRVMMEEPEHRERLWKNIRALGPALGSAGFLVSDPTSPFLTVFLGADRLARAFTAELFARGIRVGAVTYPSVPAGEALLRFSVSARHVAEDLEAAVRAMTELGRTYGILCRSAVETREIGERAQVPTPLT